MKEALYTEKLNWFKQHEKPETVLMVADTQELIKIIIAWSNLEVKPADDFTELMGDSEYEIWDWLWENARFRLNELKIGTGVPYSESVLEQKMKPLIGQPHSLSGWYPQFVCPTLLKEQSSQAFRGKDEEGR